MKDKVLTYLLGAVALVSLISLGIVTAFKDNKTPDKVDPIKRARKAKAELSELRKEATELGINTAGLSADELKKQIQLKSENHGETEVIHSES